MGLNRRTFLQRAGLGLLTWGVSQTGLFLPAKKGRISATWAAPTPRKLALLVGINDYTDNANLKGCIADVELQKELLLHRFGFKEQDILTLTGEQATRDAIERAFLEHLTEQATQGDVVVFHFSGYGRQVKVPQTQGLEETEYRLVNSLMPSDGIFSNKGTPATNDLLEETLILLGRSLATDKLTMVLDTSYHATGRAFQGNLRVRSFPSLADKLNPEELAFQEQLQRRIKTGSSAWQRSGIPLSGTILSAAAKERVATEMALDGFNTGLFTYALTQYLWESEPASRVIVAMSRTAEQMTTALGTQQEPQTLGSDKPSWLTYYLLPENPLGAEGAIAKVESDDTVEIYLTGLPAGVLKSYGLNSCFSVVSPPDVRESILQIRSRDGIVAKAKRIKESEQGIIPLKVGQLVRETIRILPRQLGLTVALDPSLERIERVDATSAFASISSVSGTIVVGEQAADCLLAKVPISDIDPENQKSTTKRRGYGLFSVGGVALSKSIGAASEAVKSAIGRLEPQFQKLLAAKLWRLTANEGSSRLGVGVSLEVVGKNSQTIIHRNTSRKAFEVNNPSSPTNTVSAKEGVELPRLPIGTQIQYKLENLSDRPIYFLLLGIDSSGQEIALYVPQLMSNDLAKQDKILKLQHQYIPPGDRLIVPRPSTAFNWNVSAPAGIVEIHIVCATAPFTKTLEALNAIDYLKGDKEQILSLPNPLAVSQALLQDLHVASAVESEITGTVTDIYALDTKAWATLSFVYQVV